MSDRDPRAPDRQGSPPPEPYEPPAAEDLPADETLETAPAVTIIK
jgi:hypothetical protein